LYNVLKKILKGKTENIAAESRTAAVAVGIKVIDTVRHYDKIMWIV
jgi:hypothetical protein